MTVWSGIANSEVAVDTPIDSLTETKFKNRDDYLLEVLNGTNTDKVPAQALQVYASGAGSGLKVKQFQWNEATGSSAIASGETVELDTGLVPTENKVFLSRVWTITSLTGLGFNWEVQVLNGKYLIKITRTTDGGIGVTVNWHLVLLAVA